MLRFGSVYFNDSNIKILRKYVYLGLSYVLFLSIIFSLILILFRNFISTFFYSSENLSGILLISGIILPFLTLIHIQRSLFKSFKLPATSNIASLNFILLITALFTLLIYYFNFSLNINRVYFIFLISTLIVFGLNNLIIIIQLINKNQNESQNFIEFDKIFKNTQSDFYILDILNYFLIWGSLYLMGMIISPDQLGIFNTLFWYIFAILIIPVTVDAIISPEFAIHSSKKNDKKLSYFFSSGRKITYYLSIPLLIFMFVFADFFLNIIFAEMEIKYLIVCRILIITVLIEIIFSHMDSFLVMSGLQKQVRNLFIFTTLFSILTIIFLTNYYGIIGASFAFLTNFLFKNLILFFYFKRYYNL